MKTLKCKNCNEELCWSHGWKHLKGNPLCKITIAEPKKSDKLEAEKLIKESSDFGSQINNQWKFTHQKKVFEEIQNDKM